MAAGLTEGRVVLVCGEPVDQIAFRDHVLVLQRQGAELAEADPLADRVAVIAGELHDSGHVDHVRVGGELAFIVAPRLLRIVGERRLNANLVGLHFLVSVFVPAGGYDVPAGIDLPVDHKVDDVAFFDGVAAGFLPGADVGDQIELQQIVRRPLADMADLAQLLLVHDFRVLFEFLCIVCHDEAPFCFFGPKGCFIDAAGVSVFLPDFLQTRKNRGFLRKNAVLFELWAGSNQLWPIRVGMSSIPCGAWVFGSSQSCRNRPAPTMNLPKIDNTRNPPRLRLFRPPVSLCFQGFSRVLKTKYFAVLTRRSNILVFLFF